MKYWILIDNLSNKNNEQLLSEHGLSIFFKCNGKNYLVDTGASSKFIDNLALLNNKYKSLSDIQQIDAVIISHAHNDHCGGLRSFIENNNSAPIYIHQYAQGNYFFSCRNKSAQASSLSPQKEFAGAAEECSGEKTAPAGTGGVAEAAGEAVICSAAGAAQLPSAAESSCVPVVQFRSIGMEQALFFESPLRFKLINEGCNLSENIYLLPMVQGNNYPKPMGNKYLYMNDFPDNFLHEVATIIHDSDGLYTIISPCSHNGILNILEQCVDYLSGRENLSRGECCKKIKGFIGGLHYVDYLLKEHKNGDDMATTVNDLLQIYPNIKIFSGHCTCENASNTLKQLLADKYEQFFTGSIIEL